MDQHETSGIDPAKSNMIKMMGSDERNPQTEQPAVLEETEESPQAEKTLTLIEGGLLGLFREYGYIFLDGSEKEEEFQSQISEAYDAVVSLSADGTISWYNGVFVDLFGFSEIELEEYNLLKLVHAHYHHLVRSKMKEAAGYISRETGLLRDRVFVFRGYNGYGELRSFECLFGGYWRSGKPQIIAVLRDVTLDTNTFLELKRLEKNYNILSETVNEAIVRINENFTIVFANSAVKRIFGYTKEELHGRPFDTLFPPEIYQRHEKDFRKYFFVDDEDRDRIGLSASIEILGMHKSRGISPMEVSFGNSTDFLGRTLTCIIRDITEQKNTERQLRQLAYQDKLTNLGNRDLFRLELKQAFDQLEKYPMLKGALMFLDLDGFKQINDTMGHNVGDALLLETAVRLRECLRVSDSIYRFGGDEFVILLKKVKSRKDAAKVARKVLAVVRQPYYLSTRGEQAQKTMVNIGVSVGIALYPEDGNDHESLVQNADLAMYESKAAGKNQYMFYHQEMVSKATQKMRIEQGLKNALHNNQFQLHYQPLVNIRGEMVGMEALLRWSDPELGEVPPHKFIPIAEEKGLIIPLGTWILETVCRQIRRLTIAGYRDHFVCVNLSPIQLEDRSFLDTLNRIIERSEIDPSRLKLEITESSLMRNPDTVIGMLEQIKAYNPGINIVIDDFGTGYSSLSYLSKLPADILKIDISFVSNLHQSHNRKIIKTILNLARSLNLSVVAEGVEAESQWNYFKTNPAIILQGFHFSRPLNPKDLYQYMKKRRGLYASAEESVSKADGNDYI